MPTFDVVSKPDWSEIKNALNQAQKEIAQRYDFRGTDASIDLSDQALVIVANSDDRVRAVYDVMIGKLTKREVSLKHFSMGKVEPGASGNKKARVAIQEGLSTENAKLIVKIIKDSGAKVQASIIDQAVRVTGKKKDDLQGVIQMLKQKSDLDVALQFQNFRD